MGTGTSVSGKRYYAGIGSRETPIHVLDAMRATATALAHHGWILRTGGAPGADTAFLQGAMYACNQANGVPLPEWYAPWPSFQEGKKLPSATLSKPEPWTYNVAAQLHPKWGQLHDSVKALHARNVHQITGPMEAGPTGSTLWLHALSFFVLCWTPDGAESASECTRATGGTATAIRLACKLSIPVINMMWEESYPGRTLHRLLEVPGVSA